jgi:hypothetical protein
VAAAQSAARYPFALKLRVPINSKLQVSTDQGIININGLPASLSARSASGDINFNLPVNPNVSLTAHSLNGSVFSPENKEIKTKYQAVQGTGFAQAGLYSETGIIRLSSVRTAADAATRPENITMKSEAQPPAAAALPPILKDATSTDPRANASTNRPPVDAPLEVDEDDVVKVETDLVTLNASVVERSTGRVIKGLTQKDFRIEEDGVEQKIEHFETVNAPFDLLLLIDLSGSTAKVTDIIRAATTRFVSATRPQDRIAIVAFSGSATVVSPFTSDKSALATAINRERIGERAS